MKALSLFFFYTYIGLVILAGFWGAFINPAFDFRLLFKIDIQALPDFERINLLSQYRFLRAIELGFGLFAVIFRRNIFNERKFNTLFLFIMLSGILARLVSILTDGIPSALMCFFLAYELLGWVLIYLFTKKNINHVSI